MPHYRLIRLLFFERKKSCRQTLSSTFLLNFPKRAHQFDILGNIHYRLLWTPIAEIMCRECESICVLWVLNEIIENICRKNKKNVGAVWD